MSNAPKTLNPDPLLNPVESGAYLNENPHTLANKRSRGEGPNYVRLGRLIRYRKSDLDAYLEAHVVRLDTGDN